MDDTANQTDANQTADTQAPAKPDAPATEQTSEVKAALDATAEPASVDPTQPVLDLIKAQGDLISELVDQVNAYGDRVAALEKAVDDVKESIATATGDEDLAAKAAKMIEDAFGKVAGDLIEDVRKIKAKLHHM